MAAVALALAGAFSTNAMNKDSKLLINRQGYLQHSPTNCEIKDMCRTEGGPVCRVGGGVSTPILWGLDGDGKCVVPLFKIP